MIIESVVTQHAEEAAFLWLLRKAAVRAPHYSLQDLAHLDDRVEAHIDGLRVAGEDGWRLCAEALAYEESGEVFVAGVLAVESGDAAKFRQVCDVATANPECAEGLVSALAWAECDTVADMLRGLTRSVAPVARAVGHAAAAVRRETDDFSLMRALSDETPPVQARCTRAAGELKRLDLIDELSRFLQSEDEDLRFWAAWSCSLMGQEAGHKPLRLFGESGSPYAERALNVYLRIVSPESGVAWLKALNQRPEHRRRVVQGAGVLGDPGFIPWLVKQMSEPELARVAGESFAMITGVDLAYEDLDGDQPSGFEAGPTEEAEDENVAMDPDEDLPWPDPNRVAAWWEENKVQFRPGMRYLMGKPIDEEQVQWALRHGFQRQREAAAIELAIRYPVEPLFETRAVGLRQMRLLGVS